MKDFLKNLNYSYHKFVLIFLSTSIFISSILYFFDITHYNQNFYIFVYLLISGLTFLIFIKKKIVYLIFIFLIFFTASVVAGNIFDLSADGRSAHLVNNFFHLNNYNPFYDPCAAKTVEKNNDLLNFFWIGTYNAQFANHSITFLENIFVILTKNVEASKALKIIIFLSSLYPLNIFLNEFKFSRKIKNLFFFIILFNPIIFTQFFDSYKDFYGYYLILNSIIYFYLILKKNSFHKENYFFLLLNLFILASAKFNFFCFSIFFGIIFSISLFLKFKLKKVILFLPLFLLFLTTFAGFTPTIKTFVLNSPIFVSDKQYLETKLPCWDDRNPVADTRERAIKFNKETTRIYKFFHGLLTKGSPNDYQSYPKINFKDFYKFEKGDFYYHFVNAVPHYGGGGPFFGIIFIFLILYTLYFSFKKIFHLNFKNFVKENGYELLLILIVFLSVIIFPYPNIFRLVPQVWLIPPLILILYLKLKQKGFIINLLKLFLTLNVILVLYANFVGAYYGQNMFKKNNKLFFQNLTADENIEGWFSNWGFQLYQYSKISDKFNIKKVKSINMNECKKVLHSYNTQGSFCLDKIKNQKIIIEKINENTSFYKKIFSKFSNYYPRDVIIEIKNN